MDVSPSVVEYLDRRINDSSEFQSDWTEIKDFYTRKLWHQLTTKLQSCFNNPNFRAQTDLVQLNEVLLNDFKNKINPLALTELCVPISEQIVASDPQKGIKFMEEIRDKYTQKSKEAAILCNTTIGMIYLTSLNDLPNARQVIESTGVQLEQLGGVTCVHSRFYRLSSRYYQVTAQHADYHREALRFLGCVKLSDLTLEEQRAWAFSVGLAAILGEGVYNFGELLTHDVLNSLHNTPDAWLVDLLNAFNHGDINQLEALRGRWSSQADLVAAEPQLRDKVTLLCLAEMIFRRPANKRTLSFSEITAATQVPGPQVEHFLMRALSLGLIKGRIDEVNQSISISWLKPRVLDREQIGSMRVRLEEWCRAVSDMKSLVEVDAKTILA
ncbi:26S proteasome non-ATPase regulatory subunit [Paragonimus heterotremus]|uniref:26S proteasome non-ATPase regulatory subunit 13 n=1 Tax=Paragonimus heterotremus TaxID=100268 RepID=A0A8J4TH09_9TREM|nr:26S proteasome non-ATPase regulatory subunit [Paragonimus heterotremus]